MSRWGGELTSEEARCLLRGGIRTLVVGVGNPNTAGLWSVQQATSWLTTARSMGIEVRLDAYIYLYMEGDPVRQVDTAMSVLTGVPVGTWWLDAEDTESPRLIQDDRRVFLQRCVARLAAVGVTPGIYTGRWWWRPMMGPTTEFGHLMLWDAWFPEAASADNPVIEPWPGREYGGFSEPTMYQFKGTTDLCGQSVDLGWDRRQPPVDADRLSIERWPVDTPPGWVSGGYRATYTRVDGTPYEHGGIDFAAPRGTHVYAPCDGTVSHVYPAGAGYQFGNWVNIESGGLFLAIAHLDRFADGLAVGQRVSAGDLIGYVGHTGAANGDHVHMAVSTNPGFPLDFSSLRDPNDYYEGEEDDVALREDVEAIKAVVDKLKAVVAANGVRVESGTDADGNPTYSMLTGDAALDHIYNDGQSIHLGLALTQDRVATLEASDGDDGACCVDHDALARVSASLAQTAEDVKAICADGT